MKKTDRLSNRTELAKLFATLGFRVGAEVGVCSGIFSEILCKNIPNLRLYAIDSWDRYSMYRDFADKITHASYYKVAMEKLAPYNCVVIKDYSMEAVKEFDDGMLDFVYIDANHAYKFVKEDVREWTKKVRIGGIVSGHDYYKTKAGNMGVINAVDEYVKENGYKFNRTAWNIRDPQKDERQPSWYFVKTH